MDIYINKTNLTKYSEYQLMKASYRKTMVIIKEASENIDSNVTGCLTFSFSNIKEYLHL